MGALHYHGNILVSSQLMDAVPCTTLPYADSAIVAGTEEMGGVKEDQPVDGSYRGECEVDGCHDQGMTIYSATLHKMCKPRRSIKRALCTQGCDTPPQ